MVTYVSSSKYIYIVHLYEYKISTHVCLYIYMLMFNMAHVYEDNFLF